jgi:antitoxin CptB
MIDPTRKAKIQWQCRRGMLELDLLLNQFIEQALDKLQESQVQAFEKLLTSSDVALYAWLIDNKQPTDKELLAIVELIQKNNQPR